MNGIDIVPRGLGQDKMVASGYILHAHPDQIRPRRRGPALRHQRLDPPQVLVGTNSRALRPIRGS